MSETRAFSTKCHIAEIPVYDSNLTETIGNGKFIISDNWYEYTPTGTTEGIRFIDETYKPYTDPDYLITYKIKPFRYMGYTNSEGTYDETTTVFLKTSGELFTWIPDVDGRILIRRVFKENFPEADFPEFTYPDLSFTQGIPLSGYNSTIEGYTYNQNGCWVPFRPLASRTINFIETEGFQSYDPDLPANTYTFSVVLGEYTINESYVYNCGFPNNYMIIGCMYISRYTKTVSGGFRLQPKGTSAAFCVCDVVKKSDV